MSFFEKPEPEIKFPKDKKIDKHIKFSLAEKELSLDDYTNQLNFHAEAESLSSEPNLSEKEGDGSEIIEQRIKDIKEALDYYESLPKNEKIEAKISELKDLLKRIDPHSVTIDPNLN
jgi:rubrerythrin